MSQNDLPALVLIFLGSLLGSNFGSFSTIRREYHAQHIYHRCIMPNVNKVCMMPGFLGLLVGLGIYMVIEKGVGFSGIVATIAASIVAFVAAYSWARQRGLRIYRLAVEREGLA